MAAPHWLRIQLSGPHGFLARPMAHLLNRFNGQDYQRALQALGAKRGETILELGFGGGVGVDALLKQGTRVMAAEPAEEMRERAFRRWSRELAQGRLEVWSEPAEQLPDRQVDRALSMNTVYFWQDIELGFERLSRMVGERVVLGIAPPSHLEKIGFAEEGFRLQEMSWYRERLVAAGFECQVLDAPDENHCGLLIGNKPSVAAP